MARADIGLGKVGGCQGPILRGNITHMTSTPHKLSSIRRRTLLVLIATLVGLMLVLGVMSHLVIHSGFLRLEQRYIDQELEQIEALFTDQCDYLERKAADWAIWDDMYHYMVEPNTTFSDANLVGNNLRTLAVNMLLLHTMEGKLIHSSAYDTKTEQVVNIDPAVLALLHSHPSALQVSQDHKPQRFIFRLDNKALLLVSWPILTSASEGDPHGTLIMGRWMDDDWVAQMSILSHRQITMMWRDQLEIPPASAASLDGDLGRSVIRDDSSHARAFVRIPTTEHEHSLIIQVPLDRAIMQQGDQTFAILLVVLACAGGILAVTVLVTLDWTVLTRLSRLSARVAEISQTNDQEGIVADTGKDELGSLGLEVNRLLAIQRGWRDQVASRNASMSLIFNTLPIGLITLDSNGCVQPERSSASGELLGRNDLDGADFGELIAPGPDGAITRRRLLDYLQLVRAGHLSPEELEAVNPVKNVTIQSASGTLILSCRFYRIDELNRTTRRLRKQQATLKMAEQVLVTITNVSDEQRLAAEVARSQADYQQLKAMAEDVDLFNSFINSSRAIIAELSTSVSMLNEVSHGIRIQDIQRSVGRLAQGGEIFRLTPLHQAAKKFDTELVSFLGMLHMSESEMRRCRYGVADLESTINQIEQQFRTLLGMGGEEESSRSSALIRQVSMANTPEELRVKKRQLISAMAANSLISTRVGLAATIRSMPLMARRRELDVRFTVIGEEVPVEQHTVNVLNHVLPHLLRFIFDFGLDLPEERRLAKKPQQITLTLSCERKTNQLVFTLVDDGHGIDPQDMRRKAIEQNILSNEQAQALSDQQAQELAFVVMHDEGNNSDSGVRFVGINLIIQRLRDELQANVTVQTTVGQGTAIIIAVPLSKPDKRS